MCCSIYVMYEILLYVVICLPLNYHMYVISLNLLFHCICCNRKWMSLSTQPSLGWKHRILRCHNAISKYSYSKENPSREAIFLSHMIHNLSRANSKSKRSTQQHIWSKSTMTIKINDDQLHPAAAIFRTVGKEHLFYWFGFYINTIDALGRLFCFLAILECTAFISHINLSLCFVHRSLRRTIVFRRTLHVFVPF